MPNRFVYNGPYRTVAELDACLRSVVIALSRGLLNGDLNAAAAIEYSKLVLTGKIVDADISPTAAIAESKLDLATDAAAGTGSRRTIGTGALQACAGNDARLSDGRTPTTHGNTLHTTGVAAGASAPGDTAAEGASASVARADHRHSREAFGTTAGTVCQGNDSRLSDSRAPNGTAGGELSGSFPSPLLNLNVVTADPTSLTDGRTWLLKTKTDVTTVGGNSAAHYWRPGTQEALLVDQITGGGCNLTLTGATLGENGIILTNTNKATSGAFSLEAAAQVIVECWARWTGADWATDDATSADFYLWLWNPDADNLGRVTIAHDNGQAYPSIYFYWKSGGTILINTHFHLAAQDWADLKAGLIHFAFRFVLNGAASSYVVYVQGVSRASGSGLVSAAIGASTASLVIGSSTSGVGWLGLVDEIAVSVLDRYATTCTPVRYTGARLKARVAGTTLKSAILT